MKKLNLEEIKEICLEILICVHDFCETNKLTYYLAYGSLLGAVRHKGFIPWDDDIDIYMPRKDYEIFLKEFDVTNINKLFKTISMYNDKTYWMEFARVVNTKTILIKKTIPHIYIDVFPLDNMSNDYKQALSLQRKIRILKFLRNHKVGNFNLSYDFFTNLKNIVHTMIKILIFFIPLRYLILKIDFLAKKYAQNKMTKYIGRAVDSRYMFEIYESTCFADRILLDFEGYKFWGPKEYDKILTQYFGNYMEVPPKNKRISHSIEAYLKEE